MKFIVLKSIFVALFLGILAVFSVTSINAQNSISGMIFDDNRKPVQNIEVELLDALERLIGTRKTRGSGFYTFQRLNRGIYYIKVRIAGTNFKEKKVRIDLGDLNAIGGVDVKQVDIYLEVNTKGRNERPVNNSVIFAQNVPEESRKLYKSGLENVKKKKNAEAITNFKDAIRIFPEYFDALDSLGNLYLADNKYLEAENIFKKASEINPKSFRSFFNLAVAQNKLKKRDSAIENLKKANALDSGSINSHLLLGIIQRDVKKSKAAEKSLLKAKELSKNKVSDVHWNLALLYYYDFKRYNLAADELELYLKAIPENEKKKAKGKISEVKGLIQKIRKKAKESS